MNSLGNKKVQIGKKEMTDQAGLPPTGEGDKSSYPENVGMADSAKRLDHHTLPPIIHYYVRKELQNTEEMMYKLLTKTRLLKKNTSGPVQRHSSLILHLQGQHLIWIPICFSAAALLI